MDIHSKRKRCRLCDSSLVVCVIPIRPIPIGEHYTDAPISDSIRFPLDIYQCSKCLAVQTLDDISSDFLWKDYTFYSGQNVSHLDNFNKFSSTILQTYFMNQDHKSVLDIGSNDGSLLKALKAKGFNIQGIDPASTVVAKAIQENIPTALGVFNSNTAKEFFGDKKFNLITAFNVFAHSPQMDSMITAVRDHLEDDGLFCFEVQYLVDIIEKGILGTFFHEHMIHYSYLSAKSFLSRYNMKIIDYIRNNIQNGSIIFVCTHERSKEYLHINNTEKMDSLLKQEEALGISSYDWSDKFIAYIAEIRNEVRAFLNSASTTKVGAFGAARSGPTLAIQFGFDNRINCIYDDHPSKVNKFSPYLGLQVKPTSELNAIKEPYCLILAYIHYKTIIKANLDYLLEGGTFLIVWPNFQTIHRLNYKEFL